MPANDKDAEVSGSNDPFALGPASQLLQQIRSEHLYSNASNCSLDKYCSSEEQPSTSHDEPQSDISSLLDKLKAKSESQDKNSSNADGELDMLSLNADSIQRQFQNIIDMTSFAQMPDTEVCSPTSSRVRKVTFVDNLPEPETSDKDDAQISGAEESKVKVNSNKDGTMPVKTKIEQKSKNIPVEKQKILRSSKTSDKSKIKRSKTRKALTEPEKKKSEGTECKAVNEDDWRAINKALDAERTLNLYLKHTAGLLVRRWGEYLAMTSEQISKFELENAKEAGMIDEVIEMLEDKDRYVWQLIDELRCW